ncbi:MAG: DNA glycosylase [Actinomycetota bacterium]|nr:DNA glycosylase [Actinomycetota bacterium]
MSEGDTVYLTARRLDAALVGRRLVRGELRHPRLAEHDLAGRDVLAVSSVGKHLFIRLDDGRSLHSHLRMDGSWQLYSPGQRWRHAAHHARAVLATAHRIAVGFRLHDLALLPTSDERRLVGHLGPDLLDPDWNEHHAAEAARRLTADPQAEIGMALLDQRVMAGVGNVYRCEVCFLLGISPWAPVAELADPVEAVALARTLLRRNTGRFQRSTTGELSRGQRTWVFERAGHPCRRCGATIRRATQGDGIQARVVYYCPNCQQEPRPRR